MCNSENMREQVAAGLLCLGMYGLREPLLDKAVLRCSD